MQEQKKVVSRLSDWLKIRLLESRSRGFVVGLSGGLDSAVVALLCRKAAGTGRLLCLILPCETPEAEIRDAMLVAKKFSLKIRLIDLTGTYRYFLRQLPTAGRLAKANIKPRLRMMTLYYFANSYNYLVAGTGNKSELALGYFTKHGDGAVDILPIGDFLKKEVRELARCLGVPGRIISKPPTAGLWKNQTDESEIGMTYDEIDGIIAGIARGKKTNYGPSKQRKIYTLIRKNAHKLKPPEKFKK